MNPNILIIAQLIGVSLEGLAKLVAALKAMGDGEPFTPEEIANIKQQHTDQYLETDAKLAELLAKPPTEPENPGQ